jgi:hypothetical protein
LTVDVSDGDLQAMVERGYEGAASTDHDQQAQAVGLFLNDALLQIAEAERHDCLPRPHRLISGQMTSYAVTQRRCRPM